MKIKIVRTLVFLLLICMAFVTLIEVFDIGGREKRKTSTKVYF